MRWIPAFLCCLLAAPASADIRLPHNGGGHLVLDAPAKRIVTLSPHLTELVFAAGAESRLIATVQYSNYPPAARRVKRIGDAFRVDLEQLLSLRPDLVIAWSSGNPASLLQRLEELGLAVWRTEVRLLTDIPELIAAIGDAAASSTTAQAAVQHFYNDLDALKVAYANRPKVRYFYQVDDRPLFTVNGEHLISRALALCGGENIFADTSSLAPSVTTEAVVAANPEVLLAPNDEGTHEVLNHWLSWKSISAVARGNLFYLAADPISRATPRILSATEQACLYLQQARERDRLS